MGLYSRLVQNKEVISMPQQMLHLKGPCLPDFEQESLSKEEQEHYLESLLSSQLALARTVCCDSPFAAVLQKRLVVLQRIFYAVSNKYHDQDKIKLQQQKKDGQVDRDNSKPSSDKTHSGADALIEMGVRTGLSLFFSLLRQSWTLHQTLGGTNLCNEVLTTAADVIAALPPLSLANETKLPPLGLASLNQVTKFLKGVSLPSAGVDVQGRRLASEIVLALAAQRGSLR